MKEKTFHKTIGIIFLIVGILHLLRAIMSWPMRIGDFTIAVWFSYIIAIIVLWLSYEAFKLSKKK